MFGSEVRCVGLIGGSKMVIACEAISGDGLAVAMVEGSWEVIGNGEG